MSEPLRVLLLEDSEDDALLLLRELERGGFELRPHRVEHREQFLAALEGEAWDIVLSDYSMPAFDGLTAFSLLRERQPDLPFIFVSGHIGEERAVEAMRHGVNDYVSKDRLARLVPAVHRELRDAETRRQRRNMEEALRASEARLRRLTQNAPDIIYEFAFTPLPHFAYVSPSAEAITGYTTAEHYADPELWLKIVHPDDRALLSARLNPEREATPNTDLLRWHDRSGRLRSVEQRTVPVYVDGHLAGIEGIVRDVTDRKELEAQLLAAQRMEAVGRFAGGIAHDFNNMLTVIDGYSSLLRRKLPGMDERLHDVSRIESATERAAALVRQLLAFSRRQPRKLEQLDLKAVLTELTPLVRRLIGEHIHVELAGHGIAAGVRADRSQLEQIIMNLAVNARDAMPGGGRLTIGIGHVPPDGLPPAWPVDAASEGYVRLTVTDTGVGMAPEVLEHIFEPFYTTKEVGKGTGLGLSTVYGIVKQMEGEIRVASEPGQGTEFAIYLPATEGPAAMTDPIQPDAALEGRETILLVEDEDMVREAATEILAAHGYTIVTAEHGEAAIAAFATRSAPVDLLLADMLMPGMTGPELTEHLRKRHPALRVLYMSGYSEATLPGPCSPAQSGLLLQKPFDSRTLLRKVREALATGPEG